MNAHEYYEMHFHGTIEAFKEAEDITKEQALRNIEKMVKMAQDRSEMMKKNRSEIMGRIHEASKNDDFCAILAVKTEAEDFARIDEQIDQIEASIAGMKDAAEAIKDIVEE